MNKIFKKHAVIPQNEVANFHPVKIYNIRQKIDENNVKSFQLDKYKLGFFSITITVHPHRLKHWKKTINVLCETVGEFGELRKR